METEPPAVTAPGCTVNTSVAAWPGAIVSGALVAPVTLADTACSVYPEPALSMCRSVNVATPATAAADVVPASVAPVGFDASDTVTLPLNPVATLPPTSRAVTTKGAAFGVPATSVVGWDVKSSRAAAPGVTVTDPAPLIPSTVAVRLALPSVTPLARPPAVIAATAESELDHVTVRPLSGFPSSSFGMAVSCSVVPTGSGEESGTTLTETTGFVGPPA